MDTLILQAIPELPFRINLNFVFMNYIFSTIFIVILLEYLLVVHAKFLSINNYIYVIIKYAVCN